MSYPHGMAKRFRFLNATQHTRIVAVKQEGLQISKTQRLAEDSRENTRKGEKLENTYNRAGNRKGPFNSLAPYRLRQRHVHGVEHDPE